MLKRFSLYGFLKNQRYFEPFLILFFLDLGLSFTQIGLLVAFRELMINLLEVPSGAVADLFGRRRSMMLSFGAYIVSFALFGCSSSYGHLFVAMGLFATGEAFRTGTHKAMIFTWLRLEGRSGEKVRVYGYTRSWSKLGSALSTVIATALVLLANDYAIVFFLAVIPYAVGVINFLGYPRSLDSLSGQRRDLRSVGIHLWEAAVLSVSARRLRRLIVEAMTFEGVFKAASDYLQPVLKNLAVAVPLFIALQETRRSAVLVGAVYFVLFVGSAAASRYAHRVTRWRGGEEGGARLLWAVALSLYLALVPLLFLEMYALAALGFVILYLVQNTWRPILIGRFEPFAAEERGATVLSIESQAKSLCTMVVAPVMGVAVDRVTGLGLGGPFWPVAAMGAALALWMLVTSRRPGVGNEPRDVR